MIIGRGVATGGIYDDLSQVDWASALHYLKVEVKFQGAFTDMGTMQFLAVPYALYAYKSLEAGPQGPKGDIGPVGPAGPQGLKGDAGDPASDDQTLSFDGSNLSITVGNGGTPSTVNLATLNVPRSLSIVGNNLSITGGNEVTLPDQIQDMSLGLDNKLTLSKSTAAPIDLTRFLDDKQQLSFNSVDNTLNISGGNSVSLAALKNDADYDPQNEIQDLNLTANKLTITNKTSPTEINLVPYLDNTDAQTLSFNASNNSVTISNGNTISLGSTIAFRARKTVVETGLQVLIMIL